MADQLQYGWAERRPADAVAAKICAVLVGENDNRGYLIFEVVERGSDDLIGHIKIRFRDAAKVGSDRSAKVFRAWARRIGLLTVKKRFLGIMDLNLSLDVWVKQTLDAGWICQTQTWHDKCSIETAKQPSRPRPTRYLLYDQIRWLESEAKHLWNLVAKHPGEDSLQLKAALDRLCGIGTDKPSIHSLLGDVRKVLETSEHGS